MRRVNRYYKLPMSCWYYWSLLLPIYSIACLRFSHLTVPCKFFRLNNANYYNIGSSVGSYRTRLSELFYWDTILAALVTSLKREPLNYARLARSEGSCVPNPTSSVSSFIEPFKWFRYLAVRLFIFFFTMLEQKLLDCFRWLSASFYLLRELKSPGLTTGNSSSSSSES